MSNQQNLAVGDVVEVINDYRQWLNGKLGVIFEIIGDQRAFVEFEGAHYPAEKRAVILIENLKRVEDDDGER